MVTKQNRTHLHVLERILDGLIKAPVNLHANVIVNVDYKYRLDKSRSYVIYDGE